MRRLSLTEAAEVFGMSKSHLSECTRERKPAKGHHLYRYAVREDGRVTGFEVPESMLPHDSEHHDHGGDNDSGRGSGMEGHDAPHGDPSSAHGERANEQRTNERTRPRSVEDERENPAGPAESVAKGVASGAVTELAKEGVKAMVKPVKDADDPQTAATIGGWLKDAFLEVSPLIAGAAWAYTHQDSDDVYQVTGSLGVAAGVDLLVKGRRSIIARAFMGEPPAESSSQPESGMEGRGSADDVEREFRERAVGDGAALDVKPGLDGALDSVGTEGQDPSSQ
jgi:hypothetical protein